MTDKIGTGYQLGYTKALLDVLEWFKNHSESLKREKAYNQKNIEALLECFVRERRYFMQYASEVDVLRTIDGKTITYKMLKE